MIGSVNYVEMNVKVWCMCSGRIRKSFGGGGGGGGVLRSFVHLIISIEQAFFWDVKIGMDTILKPC